MPRKKHHIDGEIKIPRGKKLVIEPGVKVIFTGHHKLIVNGILDAKGTKQDSIYFFPSDTSVGWYGLRFIKAEDFSILEYCVLKNGKTAIADSMDENIYRDCEADPYCEESNYGGGAILIYNSNPNISHCTISENIAGWNGGGIAIMYHSNPEKLWQAGGYFNKLKMGLSVPDKGKKYSEIKHITREVSFLTGCALLMPRKTFQIVGLFDSSLFFYGDDVEYGLRIKKSGLKMLFVPAAKVWHKIDDITVDRTTPYVLYHLARSTVIVLRKNFSGIEKYYGIFLQFTLTLLLWEGL